MRNKKCSILNIRGVMVDGMWVDSPNKVKKEFLDHFSNRFCKPGERKATLQMEFPKQIHSDQQRELQSEVTNDEIKKAVWECGTDKAPGSDGFTFGFFRHFWCLVEREVYDAVRVFGLKINMSKSKILGVHVDNVKVSRAANKRGCLVLKTLFLYLGSFMGGAMHRLQAWNDIIDQVKRRLSKWKMKMLSIGGRLT
nr:RNA-directed DNA polymerase, eukaryota [Tanacetum cinerariifolium]